MMKIWRTWARKLKKLPKKLKKLQQQITLKNIMRWTWMAAKCCMYSLALATTLVLAFLVALQIPILYKNHIVNSVKPNVYRIFMNKRLTSGGTGFNVVAPSGKNYILTNAHICDGATDNQLLVEASGARPVYRRILENSGNTDLCLLEGFHNTNPLTLANDVRVGAKLTVLGHPLLNPLVKREGVLIGVQDTWVVDGRTPLEECTKPKHSIRMLRTWLGPQETCAVTIKKSYLTDIEAYPGNSGSPVVNQFGSVIGALYAINNRSNWAILVPLSDIQTLLKPY